MDRFIPWWLICFCQCMYLKEKCKKAIKNDWTHWINFFVRISIKSITYVTWYEMRQTFISAQCCHSSMRVQPRRGGGLSNMINAVRQANYQGHFSLEKSSVLCTQVFGFNDHLWAAVTGLSGTMADLGLLSPEMTMDLTGEQLKAVEI